uniref:Integrase_H2C2 domain-containing protein n=1 Tax=Loa loa TaxID=7209 RepID=A0A1I7VNI3_LOALO
MTVRALRFIKQTRNNRKLPWLRSLSINGNNMTKGDYNIAERLLIQQAQSQNLMEEEKEKWSLFQHKYNNLWKSNSRLEESELEHESKYPIYLPNYNCVTKLIIMQKQRGPTSCRNFTYLSELRHRFWIPKGRAAVKRTLSWCMTCRRWKAKPFKLPPMPNLPDTRVKRSRTFEKVGLDYLGPLSIKSNTGVERDGSLFLHPLLLEQYILKWQKICQPRISCMSCRENLK